MAYTRDWLETTPVDHTKFKEAPGAVRNTKVDVSDRLKDILSGFTSGETLWGIKLGKFLTTGTAAPSAPSGTGTAQDMNLYIRTIGTGPYADIYIRGTTGGEIRLTFLGKLCLDNARLENNTYLGGADTNGAAQNILKVNTANAIEFASHIFVPDTNPASALVLAPKGYVDAQNLSQTISSAQLVAAFGAWVDKSASYGAQTAPADGIVMAFAGGGAATGVDLIGYTDANANPTTVRAHQQLQAGLVNPDSYQNIMFPVKKGNYWKVTIAVGTPTVYWIPLGS